MRRHRAVNHEHHLGQTDPCGGNLCLIDSKHLVASLAWQACKVAFDDDGMRGRRHGMFGSGCGIEANGIQKSTNAEQYIPDTFKFDVKNKISN